MTTQNTSQESLDNTQNAQTPSKPNDKEYNFAQLRKKAEQTEYELGREREERAKLSEQVEALKAQNSQTTVQDDDDDGDNEPYIDKKTLKKHIRKLKEENETIITKKAEEIANRMLEQERRNNEVYRLKTMYPDFYDVLNEQTAQKLSEKHPELADKILKIPDEQLRKETAYQTIKSMNLHKPDPPSTNTQDQINQKQRSHYYYPSGIATPAANNTTDFSEVGKKQAWEKMQSLIKNRKG